jgi:peptidoglycan/LPS O-acetylase OafA/YrhL
MPVSTTAGGQRYLAEVSSAPVASASGPPRRRIDALTSLRFIAAMQVVAFHVAQVRVRNAPLAVRNIVGSGYTGVGLFFVLSGFILTYNYLDIGRDGRASAQSFWVARFARVYPVYALGLLISIPFFVYSSAGSITHGGSQHWLVAGAAAIFLQQAWIPADATIWNSPGWSLSVEAFFYLCFPFVVGMIRRLRLSRVLLCAFGCWLVALVAPLTYLWLHRGLPPATPATENWALTWMKYTPLLHVPEFLIGMLAGKLHLSWQHRNDGHIRFDRYVPVVAAGLIVSALALSDKIPYPLLHNGLLAPLYAALILGLACGEGPVVTLLSHPVLVLLGEASYATYLLHVPIALWLQNGVGAWGIPPLPSRAVPLVYPVAILIIPVGVLIFVERPARRAIRSRLGPYLRPSLARR